MAVAVLVLNRWCFPADLPESSLTFVVSTSKYTRVDPTNRLHELTLAQTASGITLATAEDTLTAKTQT